MQTKKILCFKIHRNQDNICTSKFTTRHLLIKLLKYIVNHLKKLICILYTIQLQSLTPRRAVVVICRIVHVYAWSRRETNVCVRREYVG